MQKVLCRYPMDEVTKKYLIDKFLKENVRLITIEPDINDELYETLKDFVGFIQFDFKIDEKLLSSCPSLKYISNVSVGYNNYDIEVMKKHGVVGTHTPYVLDNTVADMVLGLMISTARRMSEMDSLLRSGVWKDTPYESMYGLLVTGQKLGIIGMGRIGRTIAKKAAAAFDMSISYYNRRRDYEAEVELGAKYMTMDELCTQSDYIVVMTPLTEETRGFIGKKQFDLMKPTAIFINAARGPVVKEADLVEALRERKIWGAGLDVYEKEPVTADNPLVGLKNTVLLPHIGSSVYETQQAMLMSAADDMLAFLKGETPKYIVPELR